MSFTRIKRTFLDFIEYLSKSIVSYPPIQKWLKEHPKLIDQIQKRLTPKRFKGLPLTLLLAALLFSLYLFLGIAADYLTHDPLISVDVRLANLLFAFRSQHLLRFFYAVTLFAESWVVITAAILLTVLLRFYKQRIHILALWLALISSEGATYVGKLLFHRGRPDLLLRAVSEDSFSFPSGHATTVAVFYGFLAYLIIRHSKSWKVRIGVVSSTIITIILVDLSRLYLGVHFLSDVLAGNLIGFSGLLFGMTVSEWFISSGLFKPSTKFRSSMIAWVLIYEILMIIVMVHFAPLTWQPTKPPQAQTISTKEVLSLFETGKLPRYTETLLGTPQEPTNLIVIAPEQCFNDDIEKAGWILADSVSLQSVKHISKTALLNTEYPTAPITPSFYAERPHDLGFEKETDRKTVRARHHVRFWKTGFATPDGLLYVGTVSLDTGIKWGITHQIAPDIDTERDLFVSDLRQVNSLTQEQKILFIPPILGKNFSGDEFFTDGKTEFLTLAPCREYPPFKNLER